MPPSAPSFSLIIGDPLFRLQRALKIVSNERLNLVRRATVLAVIAWLPMAVWSLVVNGWGTIHGSESFLHHYEVHVRCLLAIPLLIIAEGPAQLIVARVVAHFVRSGIVSEEEQGRFQAVVRDTERTRDSWLAWGSILALGVCSLVAATRGESHLHAIVWAKQDGVLGFGGWWYLFFVRPVSGFIFLVWLWRVGVLVALFRRITKLELKLAPAHPDRAAGLGFLEPLATVFSLVVLAFTSVMAARAAHEVLAHGVTLASLKMQAGGTLVVLVVIFLSPFFPFSPVLRKARRRAYFAYGAFVGRTGARFDQRWIDSRESPGENVFDTADVSTMCDTGEVYQNATNIHPLPLRRVALFAILLPALIPMLFVVCLKVPIAEILKGLAGTLM